MTDGVSGVMMVCVAIFPMSLKYRHTVVPEKGLPIRGIFDAAGGVESASRSSNTKKATKMFIPVSWEDANPTLYEQVINYQKNLKRQCD